MTFHAFNDCGGGRFSDSCRRLDLLPLNFGTNNPLGAGTQGQARA